MAVAGLTPGKRLDISALPKGKRVNVNLYRENKEYALQVSIRYNEGAIVRNAMTSNVWGKEEREGKMPLDKKEVFDITIINEEFSFQIFLNNQRFVSLVRVRKTSFISDLPPSLTAVPHPTLRLLRSTETLKSRRSPSTTLRESNSFSLSIPFHKLFIDIIQ